ncbi:unnamed protein product [Rhodiola kirilowii]
MMEVIAGAATGRVWLSSLLRCGDNRSNKQCLAESVSVGELGFGNHRKLLVNRLTVCCGEKKKERKEKRKLVKGLEKDLAMFAALGFGIESGSRLARQVQGSMMTEAAEVLLRQLQCLREAEEEAKRRRRKQEKKAMIRMMEDLGIKASTDSGDDEKSTDFNSSWKEEYLSRSAVGGNSSAGEAVGQVLLQSLDHDTEVNHVQEEEEEVAQLLITAASPSQQNSTTFRRNKSGTKKVEICMGGKCKKFGASQVLDKFQSLAAEEEDMNVVGCSKCMGKCKEGPNVRLSSVSTAATAICSGVQIGDVDALMTSFLDIN